MVANAGSEDVSVIGFVEAFAGSSVEETGVIALGGVPVGFLTDLTGPTCANPFVWVRADDGTLFPLDMRDGAAPQCGENDCRVSTAAVLQQAPSPILMTANRECWSADTSCWENSDFLRPTALTHGVDITGSSVDEVQ
ncbi:MAG: hypothetical protein GY822_22965 [Deltaproteobacteria bacterium]|nr:hypothetical protein [Deltaproteobacteria bacterium]